MSQIDEIRSRAVAVAYDDEDEYRPEPEKPAGPPPWMDGRPRIGIHTSIAGDISQSLQIAKDLGCTALQIFSASPRMWPKSVSRELVPPAIAEQFRARREELRLGPLVIHDNYLINLCSPNPVLRVRSVQTFHDEIVRAIALGAEFLVAHPGAACGGEKRRAIQQIAQGIRTAARGFQLGKLRILLENTSGMGTSVGSRFEDLKAIIDACGDVPMGVCVDTAHCFHAGYPIHTADGLERTLEAIERTVGLRNVFVLHVNDSKTRFGSRVDRHEHIGQGHIGAEAIERILNHPLLAGRAFILETPIDKPGDDRRNIALLWKMTGTPAEQVPGARDGFTQHGVLRGVRAAGPRSGPAANRTRAAAGPRSGPARKASRRARPAVAGRASTRKRTAVRASRGAKRAAKRARR